MLPWSSTPNRCLMKIGILLPGGYAIALPGDGRKVQIACQVEALKRLGHSVVELPPWSDNDLSGLDALHVVEGSFGNYVNTFQRIAGPRAIGIVTFIDSNQANWSYRLMAWLGTRTTHLQTSAGVFRKQMLRSDLVIVRSRGERDRVIYGLGIDPARTHVEIVLNGVSAPQMSDPEPARARYNLPKEYLLHVGTYSWGRKNVARLIAAAGPTGLPLVIAGNPVGPEAERVASAARQFKNVQFLGYQDEQMLHSLYAGCKVFCLPSIHEGTGLVALEAAAHASGVVITRNGGPPDYFADLAYYVDPYDIRGIRETILRAWENPRGQELRSHVLQNLTWEQSAQSLVRAYQRVLERHAGA